MLVRGHGGFQGRAPAEPPGQGPGRRFRVTGPGEVNHGEGPVIQADGNLIAAAAAGKDSQCPATELVAGTDLGCRLALNRGSVLRSWPKPELGQIPYLLAGHGQQDKRSPGAQEANSIAGLGNHARTIRSIPPGHAACRTPVPARSSACGGAMHQLPRPAVRGWPWVRPVTAAISGSADAGPWGGLPGGPATQGDDAGHVAIRPRGSRTALRSARRPGPRLPLGRRSRGCRRSGRPARSGPASARPLRPPPRRPACR